MCGIGGILKITRPGEQHEPIPEAWLDALDARIAWRGPDGAGRFRDRVVRADGATVEVALVHRRLSIIDHEGGGQPMVVCSCPRCVELGDPDEKSSGADAVVVAFNGCIYNHRSLRKRLEDRGHTFASHHSDTEVLAHGWREWGPWLIENLAGMYAFAVWDRRRGWLTVARDRFGEKPLFWTYSLDQRHWAFASSVAAMAALRSEIEPAARPAERELVNMWLGFGYSGGSFTIDQAAHPIGPGEVIVMPVHPWPTDAPQPLPRATWRDDVPPLDEGSTDRLEHLLSNAVAQQLEADVPVGTFLSGGIDSSLITLMAHRHRGDVPAFTVRMPDVRMDESPWATLAARHIGCRHIILDCPEFNAAEDLRRLIGLLGEPFADSSILPTAWVCRAARRVVKVALGGDGGDELFFGYRRYRAVSSLRRWGLLLRLVPKWLIDQSKPSGRAAEFTRMIDAARGDGYPELGALFSSDDRSRLTGAPVGLSVPWTRASDEDWARRLDVVRYLPCDLLRKIDTASMAEGLEVRCPFLDHDLASAAMSTPVGAHTARGETKHFLRQLARRYFPPELADRPKQGFAIPISDWWRTDFGGLRTLLFDCLDRPRPFGDVHDVLPINMDYVRRMIDEHWAAGGLTQPYSTKPARRRDHGQRLFALVTLALWAREKGPRGQIASRQ